MACPTGAAVTEETWPLPKAHRKWRRRRNISAYLLVLSFNPQPLPFNWPILPRSWWSRRAKKSISYGTKSGQGKGEKVF